MNHPILQDIFDAAATLPNKETVAAIEQLLIEACSQFEGAKPNGFKYGQNGSSPTQDWVLFTQCELTLRSLCGIGETPETAYNNLIENMGEWFTTTPDRRTESIN